MPRTDLPPPADLAAPPRVLVGRLAEVVGEAAAVDVCVALLGGADGGGYAAELPYLAGRPAAGYLDGTWAPYWSRVWGARGLLYVWEGRAARSVVAGLGDPAWRVAEMCLKVSALRELAEAGDDATVLVRHELPRVRLNAVRTLGLVGDTEHVAAVRAHLDDGDPLVRRAADLALQRLTTRLDLPT